MRFHETQLNQKGPPAYEMATAGERKVVARDDIAEAWVSATEDRPSHVIVAVAVVTAIVKIRHDLQLQLGRARIGELSVYIISSGRE